MTDLSPDVQKMLDESYESDLTEEESERLLVMCGHGIGPKLSPAAQAVLDAGMEHSGPAFEPVVRRLTAAALRAAALYCKRDKLILLSFADELDETI